MLSAELLQRNIFIASTLRDELPHVRGEVARFLEQPGVGIRIIRSEMPGFSKGLTNRHKHDLCLDWVDETPKFILIVDKWAGRDFEGEDSKYSEYLGSTITHAETRHALKKSHGFYWFVSASVIHAYNLWSHEKNREIRGSVYWDIDIPVFELIADLKGRNICDPVVFTELIDLKPKVAAALGLNVVESQQLAPEIRQ